MVVSMTVIMVNSENTPLVNQNAKAIIKKVIASLDILLDYFAVD